MDRTAGQKRCWLFGGDKAWKANDWADSDDRVRGGKSQSYLECTGQIGRFHGTLDIKALGGAGFASQRTTGEDRNWDLSDYAGIEICVSKGDKKRYTFNLKDKLLPPHPTTGREQSSITYECDFELPPQTKPGPAEDKFVFIPWRAFNATYRGRLKKDAKPINLKEVKRMSIMMRSFFGTQEGEFSLSIRSICALSKAPSREKGINTVNYDMLEKGQAVLGQAEVIDPNDAQREPAPGYITSLTQWHLLLGTTALLALYFLIRSHGCRSG